MITTNITNVSGIEIDDVMPIGTQFIRRIKIHLDWQHTIEYVCFAGQRESLLLTHEKGNSDARETLELLEPEIVGTEQDE